MKKKKDIGDRGVLPTLPTPLGKKLFNKSSRNVLAIDPGKLGAFALFDGERLRTWSMPLTQEGKDEFVSFPEIRAILKDAMESHGVMHVYLERAVSFGMGTKGAFNYGRGFAALEIAIALAGLPVTYVEPGKWTKEIHAGISGDLKPKAKSLIALKRLLPHMVEMLPRSKKGALLDGAVDALLIATYALRQLGVQVEPEFDFM